MYGDDGKDTLTIKGMSRKLYGGDGDDIFMLILVRILYMAMEVMIHLLLQVMILQYVAAPVMISLRLAEMIILLTVMMAIIQLFQILDQVTIRLMLINQMHMQLNLWIKGRAK